ncbi:hypothetical protein AURDEDRAFT_183459 [Auricularia subglabra TFB-10046 SS5]|nr:hypothetical protein AURDEDRAFT_183459 [Auricularia subglabra TFB-10046 SS5]
MSDPPPPQTGANPAQSSRPSLDQADTDLNLKPDASPSAAPTNANVDTKQGADDDSKADAGAKADAKPKTDATPKGAKPPADADPKGAKPAADASSKTGAKFKDAKAKSDGDAAAAAAAALDLLPRVKGMYRFLDIVSEQASGGLVDNIVIDQDGFKAFANAVCPGAYSSLTKVDFSALDKTQLELVGIYGSKGEIARFLSSIGHASEQTAALLTKPIDPMAAVQTTPYLRSGLYIVDAGPASADTAAPRRNYVIYWPEDTTWSDHAPSASRRNRVAFIRYLTKLTDQILVFVSPEHAQNIVWKDSVPQVMSDAGDDDDDLDDDDDIFSSDRVFDFSVEKKAEQDEGVQVRAGFRLAHKAMAMPADAGDDAALDSFTPRLVFGETTQGFLTAKPQPARTVKRPFRDVIVNGLALRKEIEQASAIRVGPDVSEEGLEILAANGLDKKASALCRTWLEKKDDIHKQHAGDRDKFNVDLQKEMDAGHELLRRTLYTVLAQHIIGLYPESLSPDVVAIFAQDTASQDTEGEQ